MAHGTSHLVGFICKKDRMVRGLTGYTKASKRMAKIMSTKRKIEELEMLRDVLRLTNET